jgi:hypothetical protein
MRIQLRYNRSYRKGQHKPMSRYEVKFFKEEQRPPVFARHTNGLLDAVKHVFIGWKYTFKFPTTVSKSFFEVLLMKIGF